MRTIGYRHHGPRKDHQSSCHYCGDVFLRSELYGPDENGYLACADDRPGRTEKQLDYIRALNASQPTEVRGARDRPGPTPDAVTLIGWGWFKGQSVERIAGNLPGERYFQGFESQGRAVAGDYGSYAVEVVATWAAVYAFDNLDPTLTNPRFAAGRIADDRIQATVLNRFEEPDSSLYGTERLGDFLVLAYSDGKGQGIVSEVATVFVDGATAATVSGDGEPVTVSRSSTGIYVATIPTTYAFATVNRMAQNETEVFANVAFVWGGRIDNSTLKIRSLASDGTTPLDSSFLVKFYR